MLLKTLVYIYTDENGDREILSLFRWFISLAAWRIIAEHLRDIHGEVVPEHILKAIAAEFLPAIRAFFETEEGKREFAEWKAERDRKLSAGGKGTNRKK